jgi:hypothetical protein
MLLGAKHKDEIQLRPIFRPNYQGDNPVQLDDDDEYEPVVEKPAEQKRVSERAGRCLPAEVAIQPTGM